MPRMDTNTIYPFLTFLLFNFSNCLLINHFTTEFHTRLQNQIYLPQATGAKTYQKNGLMVGKIYIKVPIDIASKKKITNLRENYVLLYRKNYNEDRRQTMPYFYISLFFNRTLYLFIGLNYLIIKITLYFLH